MEKKVKKDGMTLDKLARMVQDGFLSTEERMVKMNSELKSDIANVRVELADVKAELKSDIADVKADLNKRVDIFTHKELEFRVEKIEEKVGAKK